VRREFVVQSTCSIVALPRVPINASPGLMFHFGEQPIDQELTDSRAAVVLIDD
jgi:hypothetical protein